MPQGAKVRRNRPGKAKPYDRKQKGKASGKLGIFWHHDDGSVLQFHDDYW